MPRPLVRWKTTTTVFICRWLRDARKLEELGYRGRTDISETVRPGGTDYGFDYTKNYKERTDRTEP